MMDFLNTNISYIKKHLEIENGTVMTIVTSIWNFIENACNDQEIGVKHFVVIVKFVQQVIEEIKIKSYTYEELENLEMIALRFHSLLSIIFSFYRSKFPYNDSFILIVQDTGLLCRDALKEFLETTDMLLTLNTLNVNDLNAQVFHDMTLLTPKEILRSYDYLFSSSLIKTCFGDRNRERLKLLIHKISYLINDQVEHLLRIEFDVARNEKSEKMSYFYRHIHHNNAPSPIHIPKGNEMPHHHQYNSATHDIPTTQSSTGQAGRFQRTQSKPIPSSGAPPDQNSIVSETEAKSQISDHLNKVKTKSRRQMLSDGRNVKNIAKLCNLEADDATEKDQMGKGRDGKFLEVIEGERKSDSSTRTRNSQTGSASSKEGAESSDDAKVSERSNNGQKKVGKKKRISREAKSTKGQHVEDLSEKLSNDEFNYNTRAKDLIKELVESSNQKMDSTPQVATNSSDDNIDPTQKSFNNTSDDALLTKDMEDTKTLEENT